METASSAPSGKERGGLNGIRKEAKERRLSDLPSSTLASHERCISSPSRRFLQVLAGLANLCLWGLCFPGLCSSDGWRWLVGVLTLESAVCYELLLFCIVGQALASALIERSNLWMD